ncbi:unnamed protein product, partial [Discosporangium mesarthrocarpum]
RKLPAKYRRTAAASLSSLIDGFPECCVYERVAPTLLRIAHLGPEDGCHNPGKGKEEEEEDNSDPIMEARAITCLAAAWPRLPATAAAASAPGATGPSGTAWAAVHRVQRRHAARISQALARSFRLKVWSVRVPILKAMESIVRGGGGGAVFGRSVAAPVVTGAVISDAVQVAEAGTQDLKYSQVRAAALSVILALASRKELRVGLTPHKEGLLAAARRGAEDKDPRVATVGSKAAQMLAWWP